MRTSSFLLAGMLAIALALAVACDDDDRSDEPVQPAGAAREAPGGWSAAPETPADPDGESTSAAPTSATTSAVGPAGAATPAPVTVTPAPQATAAPPTPQDTSVIGINLERFDCGGYRFVVQSQPAALYKVHWTASAPADPGQSSSRSVSDNEASQSPAEHSFSHADDDWAEPGSNRLHITAWDADGQKQELTKDIDC